jgi:hypothetical protein
MAHLSFGKRTRLKKWVLLNGCRDIKKVKLPTVETKPVVKDLSALLTNGGVLCNKKAITLLDKIIAHMDLFCGLFHRKTATVNGYFKDKS